jgi:hypothetical protein
MSLLMRSYKNSEKNVYQHEELETEMKKRTIETAF